MDDTAFVFEFITKVNNFQNTQFSSHTEVFLMYLNQIANRNEYLEVIRESPDTNLNQLQVNKNIALRTFPTCGHILHWYFLPAEPFVVPDPLCDM